MREVPSIWQRCRAYLMRRRPGAGWRLFLVLGVALLLVRTVLRFASDTDLLLISASWAFLAVGGLVFVAGRGARRYGQEEWERRVKSRLGRIILVTFSVLMIVTGVVLIVMLRR